MAKDKVGSRTSRRLNTKSAMRVRCQRQTKRALRMGRKTHAGTGKAGKVVALPLFRVRNSGTKREVTVQARDAGHACEVAMIEHRLAKSLAKLSAEPAA